MRNISYPHPANADRGALAFAHSIYSAAMRIVTGAVVTLVLWRLRSIERQSLLSLSDSQLKDVGLTGWEVARAAAKPFWRA